MDLILKETRMNYFKLSAKSNICCKYFTFSIMSFFGYQSFAQLRVAQTSHRGVTAVQSAKDR